MDTGNCTIEKQRMPSRRTEENRRMPNARQFEATGACTGSLQCPSQDRNPPHRFGYINSEVSTAD